ncbi:synaptogyrin-2-like [Girardinichthys multiradiatus]|uniref:synaptogyrin-2-like n=1 Tax=Girardinichthys multiradiatus TaxID=208333 RepID=UPI001FACA476|nr:synaptogyrin-2-like [Girardinichthys multiradiatus]
MQSTAYGASLAGGAFDFESYVKKPQTALRVLSWVFSIVVFASITAEGYTNPQEHSDPRCMFNDNDTACSYAVGIGILAFLGCVVFLLLDAYFPNISSAKDRKYIVIGDLAFSATWMFLWFICFCVLANQWSKTTAQYIRADAARAVIAFSFFSIVTWFLLSYFAFARYREGLSEFNQDYSDPVHDHTSPYPPAQSSYQQESFPSSQGQQGEYQPPTY